MSILEPEPLDPRWEWSEVRRLCDTEPTYIKVRCLHLDVVPVESGGEVVAGLCLTCDEQLSPRVVAVTAAREKYAEARDEFKRLRAEVAEGWAE